MLLFFHSTISNVRITFRSFFSRHFCSQMLTDSPVGSPLKMDFASHHSAIVVEPTTARPAPIGASPTLLRPPMAAAELQSAVLPTANGNPAPRHVAAEELHILQTCLKRWRTEVEQDVKGRTSLYF